VTWYERRAISVLVTPPTWEPLTLAEAKLRAGLDWVAGDARDALMTGFIKAARERVEQRTGLALPEQTRDIYIDQLPSGRLPIVLPAQSAPLRSVTSIKYFDTAGLEATLDPTTYFVDPSQSNPAQLAISQLGEWPTDLRAAQPWTIRVVAGYHDVADIPALLVHAVGLLVAHMATAGRDIVSVGHINQDMTMGFEDAIAAFLPVTLA
jgi:uncharacterized phiE125 gp8 family phage protein